MRYEQVKVGLVVAQFNEIITAPLYTAAKRAFLQQGILPEHCYEQQVPGSFELPLAAQWLIDHRDVQGVVVLGAVIRGSTDHYDYVCSGTTSGIMSVQLARSVPISFGVLTCDTLEQAFDRAGGKLGNKGAECALGLLHMIALKHALAKGV